MSKLIIKELKVLFFLPFILSTFVAAFYSYNLPVKQGAGLVTLIYSLMISLIYFCFQIVFYLVYKKLYIRKLIKDLENKRYTLICVYTMNDVKVIFSRHYVLFIFILLFYFIIRLIFYQVAQFYFSIPNS